MTFQQISVLGKIDCLHFLQDFKWCSCFPKTCLIKIAFVYPCLTLLLLYWDSDGIFYSNVVYL